MDVCKSLKCTKCNLMPYLLLHFLSSLLLFSPDNVKMIRNTKGLYIQQPTYQPNQNGLDVHRYLIVLHYLYRYIMFVTLLIKHSNIVFKIVNLRLSLIRGKSLRRSTCYERESDKRLHTAYTKRVIPL